MSDRLLISTRKGLFDLRRSSTNAWSIDSFQFEGRPATFTMRDPKTGTLFVSITEGHFGPKLHRSNDDGNTWEELNAPAFPDGGDDAKSIMVFWSMFMGANGRLWLGTIPAGVFHSDDLGDTWHMNEAFWAIEGRPKWMGGGFDDSGVHSICIDPRNPDHVSVAISIGGVWRSEDGGASWRSTCNGMRADYTPPDLAEDPDQQDPHCVSQCAAAPDHLWMQHHNGIFKSDNLGGNWTEIKQAGPSTFGFPVAVHPSDPDTAWFVPGVKDEYRYPKDGKFVVTRTRDGGQSFDVLDKGLPQAASYDIVYRHALSIDKTGNRLAMGSTTGGVWVTENGGDEWSELPERFPPVAAVTYV